MKYYSITPSRDIGTIGAYPQIEIEKNAPVNSSTSFRAVRINDFPDFEPDFNLQLNKGALPTDVIDNLCGFGLFVSQFMVEEINSFNLANHRYYKFHLEYETNQLEYSWMHLISKIDELIDYEKSTFIIKDRFSNKLIRDSKFTSKVDLIDLQEKLAFNEMILPKKIKFYSEFPGLDIFDFNFLNRWTVVSERLAEHLLESDLNGFNLKHLEFLKV